MLCRECGGDPSELRAPGSGLLTAKAIALSTSALLDWDFGSIYPGFHEEPPPAESWNSSLLHTNNLLGIQRFPVSWQCESEEKGLLIATASLTGIDFGNT